MSSELLQVSPQQFVEAVLVEVVVAKTEPELFQLGEVLDQKQLAGKFNQVLQSIDVVDGGKAIISLILEENASNRFVQRRLAKYWGHRIFKKYQENIV